MFTVKQLSKIAGVTPRTLHYYDEIDLLKPAQVGENGYRYYDEESLLRLQQILLYRQLNLPLEHIKQIVQRPNFDVLAALAKHKEMLLRRIAQLERLVTTVDQTIAYLRGDLKMDNKQLFAGFSDEQQAEYEREAMRLYDPAIVQASSQRWKRYSADEKQRIFAEGNAVYEGFRQAIPKGAASPEAQAAVERWRKHIDTFWTPNDEQLLALANGYNDDPRFKANFDQIHPGLAAFVRDAVQIYLKKRK